MTTGGAGPPGAYPVSGTARALVRVSTVVLPTGEARERYRLEHVGELSALAGNHQVRYALAHSRPRGPCARPSSRRET